MAANRRTVKIKNVSAASKAQTAARKPKTFTLPAESEKQEPARIDNGAKVHVRAKINTQKEKGTQEKHVICLSSKTDSLPKASLKATSQRLVILDKTNKEKAIKI